MLYPNMVLFADAILIFQNQSLEVDQPDNDADVDTVCGGRQGVAPGPDVTMITATNAVPKSGPDYNWELAKRNRTEIEVKCQQIGSTKMLKGKFLCRSFNQTGGTGAPVLQNITLSSVGTQAPIFE